MCCIFCNKYTYQGDKLPEFVIVWVYMYVVYILKWSSTHALGGVSGVASFITTDEQLQ